VISVDLAAELRAAGLRWRPTVGDRFVVANRAMDEDVFVLSTMTIDVHQFPSGPVIGFNGTTEWALDSLELDEALWLPAEHQLRDLLGAAFVSLAHDGSDWVVTLADGERVAGPRAAEAYGRALLGRLQSAAAG
jgi:hypothetical protein